MKLRVSRDLWIALLLVGCGRLDFDPLAVAATGPPPPSDLGMATTLPVPAAPTSLAAGDLDHDGKIDLLVTHNTGLGVLRGHGDGTFGAITDFPDGQGSCGLASEAVAIADLDHDGKLDVVVADCTNINSSTDGGVQVLLGNGDGTLQAPVLYPTGNAVSGVAIADLDGDGNADIAAADYYGSTVIGVLLGNGDGTFRAHVDYDATAFPSYVAIADLNADGVPDLAVANESDVTVSVLLGNGDGTFRATVNYTTGTSPESLAIGDLDGDGVPDLVVANSADFTANSIVILAGNGDGTFQAPRSLSDDYPWSIALRVDGTTRDIVVANNAGPGQLDVLAGNGDGTFQPSEVHTVGKYATSVVIADFNGDGLDDAAVTGQGDNTVSVLLAVPR